MFRLLGDLCVVSGEGVTHCWDASAYLIPGAEPTLIDCGGMLGYGALRDSLTQAGYAPREIVRVLATHGHWDHLSGLARLREEGDAELWIHEGDAKAVETGDEDKTASFLYGQPFPPLQVDRFLRDGDVLDVSGLRLEVIHTPGHSAGSVCFFAQVGGVRLLLAGDTLWAHFNPRGSDLDAWKASLDRLAGLDVDAITTGHGPPVLLLDAKRRIQEARQQFGVYLNPWFKPFHTEFRY